MIAARFLSFLLVAATVAAQTSDATKSDPTLAPYLPTPATIVERMLQLGGLKQGEKVYYLGSGDGRIVIQAARKYKADAFGVELDESLVKLSTERIRTLGLSATAHIIPGTAL